LHTGLYKHKIEVRGNKRVPVLASKLQEIEDTHRQKLDFIIQNSNYTIDYLLRIDFSEFYETILIVENNIKQRNKQI